jgi:hypothetical protein
MHLALLTTILATAMHGLPQNFEEISFSASGDTYARSGDDELAIIPRTNDHSDEYVMDLTGHDKSDFFALIPVVRREDVANLSKFLSPRP